MTYLVGNSRIESFFLVPVAFDSAVRGVLFFGSVRENAFTRDIIRNFDGLAEDEEVRNPLLYMLGGETAILRETLGQFPAACALVSRDGRIIYGNRALSQVLRIEGALPEDPDEIRRVSPFNLGGVWNEFRSLGRTLTGRKLAASNGTSGTLMVDWIRLAATYNVAENNSPQSAANPVPSGEPDLFEPDAQQWQVENESLAFVSAECERLAEQPLEIAGGHPIDSLGEGEVFGEGAVVAGGEASQGVHVDAVGNEVHAAVDVLDYERLRGRDLPVQGKTSHGQENGRDDELAH